MSMPPGAYSSKGNNYSQGPYNGQKVSGGMKIRQTPNFDPQQMELYQQLFGNVGPGSYLGRLAGGDQSMFDEMEAPAWKQFEQLQGQTASRFSGAGMGARHGSGFKNEMNQQGNDFLMGLQANRSQLRNQAIKDLMGMSNNLLQQSPYDTQLQERTHHGRNKGGKKSGWMGAGGALLGGAAGFLTGGPAGAVSGAYQGYNMGSSF